MRDTPSERLDDRFRGYERVPETVDSEHGYGSCSDRDEKGTTENRVGSPKTEDCGRL